MIYVRFTPESGHKRRVRLMSACDPKRTFSQICGSVDECPSRPDARLKNLKVAALLLPRIREFQWGGTTSLRGLAGELSRMDMPATKDDGWRAGASRAAAGDLGRVRGAGSILAWPRTFERLIIR